MDIQSKNFRWVIPFVLVMIFVFGFIAGQAFGASIVPRYLILPEYGNGYAWSFEDELPQSIEAMCWNEQEGFACDSRLYGDAYKVQTVIDLYAVPQYLLGEDVAIHGTVYRLAGTNDCWLWMWQPYQDESGNPHPSIAEWIECPS